MKTDTPFVTVNECKVAHSASRSMQRLMIGLLGVLITIMGVFVIMLYQAANKADAAAMQSEQTEQALLSETKATEIWRQSADDKFDSIVRQLGSIEEYLRNGKRP